VYCAKHFRREPNAELLTSSILPVLNANFNLPTPLAQAGIERSPRVPTRDSDSRGNLMRLFRQQSLVWRLRAESEGGLLIHLIGLGPGAEWHRQNRKAQ
jgi:hypothetical protein